MNCRQITPDEIGKAICDALQRTAADRNDLLRQANEQHDAITIVHKIDDPGKPGKFQIDVTTLDPEQSGRSVFITRLEIDIDSGEMKFSPNGSPISEETHQLGAHHDILERMCDIIMES